MKNLAKATREWAGILPSTRIITNVEKLKKEGTATFKTKQRIEVILKPLSTKEVSAIVKIASKYKIPIYPVSGGKNWGLGSKVPQRDGVLIDLSLMKKITRWSESLGYLTVEPGVTFGQGVEFLQRKKSSLMLDTLGSTPDASIIGNTAERGHGMGLYADRLNFVCGLEVVLPNGEIIETGFENFENSKLGPLSKWGVGPYVDGLFTQSNMGIITRLTIWLRSKPQYFQSFIFNVDDESRLGEVMERWRQMGLDGFQSSLRVFNDIRMISFAQRFPEGEKTPLSDKTRAVMRSKMNIGKWIGLGGMYAPSKQHAVADKEFIMSRIGDLVDNISFYDEETVSAQYALADERKKNQLDFLFNKSLLRGNTATTGINMPYWRKPNVIPVNDLHEDGCGVLWYCPAIPFTAKDVLASIKICERACTKYGFEMNIGFLFISQRCLDITGGLCYDRTIPGEDEKAMRCHDEIMKAMIQKGYSPYRLGIQSMKLVKHKSLTTSTFLKKLKKSLDVNNILAPGHYVS